MTALILPVAEHDERSTAGLPTQQLDATKDRVS
jgi:hypothetical protein